MMMRFPPNGRTPRCRRHRQTASPRCRNFRRRRCPQSEGAGAQTIVRFDGRAIDEHKAFDETSAGNIVIKIGEARGRASTKNPIVTVSCKDDRTGTVQLHGMVNRQIGRDIAAGRQIDRRGIIDRAAVNLEIGAIHLNEPEHSERKPVGYDKIAAVQFEPIAGSDLERVYRYVGSAFDNSVTTIGADQNVIPARWNGPRAPIAGRQPARGAVTCQSSVAMLRSILSRGNRGSVSSTTTFDGPPHQISDVRACAPRPNIVSRPDAASQLLGMSPQPCSVYRLRYGCTGPWNRADGLRWCRSPSSICPRSRWRRLSSLNSSSR